MALFIAVAVLGCRDPDAHAPCVEAMSAPHRLGEAPVHRLAALECGVAWTLGPAGPPLTRVVGEQIRAVHVAYVADDSLLVVARSRAGVVCFDVSRITSGARDNLATIDPVVVGLPTGVDFIDRMIAASDTSFLVQDRRSGVFAELTCSPTLVASGVIKPSVPGAEALPILGKDGADRLVLAARQDVRREDGHLQWIRRAALRVGSDSLIVLGDFPAERFVDVEGGMRPPPLLAPRFTMGARGSTIRIVGPGAPDVMFGLEKGLLGEFLFVSTSTPRAVKAADRRAWIEEALAGLSPDARGPAEFLFGGLALPDRLPSLFDVRVGSEDTTWARIWNSDSPKHEIWSAFDSGSRFLGSVLVPEGVRLMAFGDGVAAAALPSAEGWTLHHMRLVPTGS